MKAIIIFLVVFFCLQPIIKAQNFIDETKQWAIVSIPVMELSLRFTHYYKFSGDSIINGSTYHKIYQSNDSNQVNWTFSDLWWERNDSIFRYCQHYGNINDTTYLVYDFNIIEGDSFNLDNFYSMVVDSVRLIEWGGVQRKHWYFTLYNDVITWVEGVGQLGNFNCSSPCLNSMDDQLLCFVTNGNIVYQNSDYNSCYVQTSSEMLKNSSKTNISIMPSENGGIIIINPNSEKGVIVFYTIDGRLINELIIESDNTRIDLKFSGMIIYKFANINGNAQTGKFINVQP